MTSKKIIVANWKMNPLTGKEAVALFKKVKSLAGKNKNTVIVAPPMLYLEAIKRMGLGKVKLASQGGVIGDTGAQTGMVSLAMVKKVGASHAILGHSEMRARGTTDQEVAEQVKDCITKNVTPILCVGEKEREGDMWYLHAVKSQIELALTGMQKAKIANVIIAYEPIWAIGKNAKREATVKECEEMAIYIKKVLADMFGHKESKKVSILYGGSVDEKNAHVFLEQGGVDGLLVGRASLNSKQFSAIIN